MSRVILQRSFFSSLSCLQRSSQSPLEGIRILDLTRVLAAQILGDMGAEIIKIEHPLKGDETRSWGPPFVPSTSTSNRESAYFLGVNRNKKSVTVNIKSKEGIELLQHLAQKSDVLIENYIPGKLDKMGLGYNTLSKLNPQLIYASITGYGPTGPYAQRAGYDVVIEAEAGFMHITGEKNGPPVKVGVAITDLTTGLYAHGAILAALFQRQRTNQGQKIDLSLIESQVASLANVGHSYLIGGTEASRWGTAHASIVPYQAFPTLDGQIVVGTGNNTQFAKFCRVLDRPDLPANEWYSTNEKRVKNRDSLISLISDITKTKPTSEWLKRLEPLGIPFGPVNNLQQTFDHPQVRYRNMVQEIEHPTAGKIKLIGTPVKYSEAEVKIRSPPPTLGQHTEDVLSGILGYSKSFITTLREKNVI